MRANYDALKAKGDGLAAELSELYPPFAAKVADLLSRIKLHNAEISQFLQARPAGVSLHLLEPELIARGLERFTFNQPSLIDEVKLPAFEPGQPQAWPPPRNIDPAVFAPVPHNRHYSAEWGVAAEEQARVTRERHEREAAETAGRAAQRGDWWAR